MGRVIRSLVLTQLLLPLPLLAAPTVTVDPTYTGNAPEDFIGNSNFDPDNDVIGSAFPYVKVFSDGEPDVGVPTEWAEDPEGSTLSGMDMWAIWVMYNPNTDVLSVAFQTHYDSRRSLEIVAGDLDGDGDPDAASYAEGNDYPNFDYRESFCFLVGLPVDGDDGVAEAPDWPHYVVGVPSLSGGQQDDENKLRNYFTAARYLELEDPAFAFGTDLPTNTQDQDQEAIISPSQAQPHLEFRIPNFSRLPDFGGEFDPKKDALSFYWGSFMGTTSTAPGFGVDEMPVQDSSIFDRELTKITFPSPVGSISGNIQQDWDELTYSGADVQDGPMEGVALEITGEFDKDLPSTKTVYTNAAGNFSLSNVRMGEYTVRVVPEFGWEVSQGTQASFTVTVGTQEALVDNNFTLTPSDTDADGILDLVETQGADTDGDNIPNYQEVDSDGDTFDDGLEAGDDLMEPVDTDGDGKTDYTDRDSDDDGFLDRFEGGTDIDGDGVLEEYDDTDGDGIADAHDIDSDNDGVLDGTEAGVTDATVHSDTSQSSGVFVADGDPSHISDPDDQDTDDDCIPDGAEDSNQDGVHQAGAGETLPDVADTDGDGLQDGTELGYTEGVEDTADAQCVPDADEGETTTDPNNSDTDDGGKDDGDEDVNGNGQVDEGEIDPNYAPDDSDSDADGIGDDTEIAIGTDPHDADSDDDGILDGQEDLSDHDGDGIIDPLDNDSDNDGIQDGTEIGMTDDDIHPDTDPDGFEADSDPSTTTDPLDDDTDDDGLQDGTEDLNGNGAQDDGETDPDNADSDDDGLQDGTEIGLEAPEGDDTSPIIFQPDEDDSSTTDPLDDDSDDDGLQDGEEDSDQDGDWDFDETDATNDDTDGDGLQDGTESGLTEPTGNDTDDDNFEADSDPSTTTDPRDDDSDDDGLTDGFEDSDQDGAVDSTETDPGEIDSDSDGIQDGTESGLSQPQGDDTNGNVFVGDADPNTSTDPLDDDSDDDGITDGNEDNDLDGAVSNFETDPGDPDTDNDGLTDGVEDSLTEAQGNDTDPDLFEADADPDTSTDPLDDDSDDDGLLDGVEDVDLSGSIDAGETDNLNVDTDQDCLQDGTELGLTEPQGEDTDLDIFEPDADPDTTTSPLSPDTDSGGLPDGGTEGEDLNCDGAIDPGETDPANNQDDYGGMTMGGGGLRSCDTGSGPSNPLTALVILGAAFLMRSRRRLLGALTLLLGVATIGSVSAQEGSAVEIQQFHPVEDLNGAVMTAGSNTIDQGKVVFGLWINYAHNPLVYVSALGDITQVQPHVGGADLQFTVGLLDNVQLSANIPGTPLQRFADDNPITATQDPNSLALNDATVRLRWQVIDIYKRHIGLAFEPRLWLPTGKADNYTGGQFNYGGSMILDVHLGSAWFGTNLGYRRRSSTQTIGNLQIDDEFLYRAGFGLPTGPLYLTVDLYGSVGMLDQDLDGVENANRPAEVMLGLSKPFKRGYTGTIAASTGVLAGYGSPDMRFAAGISCCTPRILDSDRDGIVDSEDDCPNDPEDFDGFQDDDGCPELDNDQDGFADVEDPCPDGHEDLDGFEDDDGCPDPDNDEDSILDINDQCPLAPEDYDGIEDGDGCPDEEYRDPDRDDDGIPDKFDVCPDDAEDKDGYRDMDGCPEIDNDEDGLIDTEDKCPNRPELYNEFEDDDGCPDVKLDPGARITVRSGRIRMNKIYFDFDKDTIMPQSFQTLDAAVQVFKDNPGLRVRIEGHTDNKGSDSYNLNLSARRANSVMRYMVDAGGLEEQLFETEGYGETMPVESNNTEQGRALNRRIEWIILEAGVPSEPETLDSAPGEEAGEPALTGEEATPEDSDSTETEPKSAADDSQPSIQVEGQSPAQ